MPSITTRANTPITGEQQAALTSGYKAICKSVLKKGEEWVMTTYEPAAIMSFKGTDDPCALINVQSYGPFVSSSAEKMANEITPLVSKTLCIPGERIYVILNGVEFWGYNGHIF